MSVSNILMYNCKILIIQIRMSVEKQEKIYYNKSIIYNVL